jgi:RNA-directed DNA polymerase
MLLTEPAKKNIKNFLEKVRETLRDRRTAKQEDVIATLNPILVT